MQLDITGNLSVAQRNVDDLANILVGLTRAYNSRAS